MVDQGGLAQRGRGGRRLRWLAQLSAIAVLVMTGLVVTTAGTVEAAAVQAPLGPAPVCWSDADGPGLGCVDGPVASKVSGTYGPGSSFTIETSPNGLAPCVTYTSTGCFYSLSTPSFVRCVYVAGGDPTDVRSCPSPLSKQGSVSVTRQGTCAGALGSTYAYGGDARFPATWFSTRAREYMQCEFAVTGSPIDNLYGPTFMLYRTSVRECIDPIGPGAGCDEPSATLETRIEYVWVPVSGTLAPGEPVAKCGVDITYGETEAQLRFDDDSFVTDGTVSPTIEWTFWDASTSAADVVTKTVTAIDNYPSSTKASLGTKNDSESCVAQVEAAQLEGGINVDTGTGGTPTPGIIAFAEATNDAQAEGGVTVELGDEFAVAVDLSAVDGFGALEADVSLATSKQLDALTMVSSPDFDSQWWAQDVTVAHESVQAVSSITAQVQATKVGRVELEAEATATDAAGRVHDAVIFRSVIRIVESLTVNSTGNSGDADVGDGTCDTGATVQIDSSPVPECTLRAAIQEANQQPGDRRIKFDIPGAATPRIVVTGSPLPAITGPAILDGESQTGGRVEIQGSGIADGLVLVGADVTVQGVAVLDFDRHGVRLAGTGGHTLINNAIGTTFAGTADHGNGGAGVLVESPSNTVGSAARKNIISFNGTLTAPPDIAPGATAADVAPPDPLDANVVIAPAGGGTVTGNDLQGGGVGVFVDAATDPGAVTISGNTVEADLGVVTWPSSARVAGVTVSGNTFTGTSTTDSIAVLVGGDLTDSDPVTVTDNTINGVGSGVVVLGATYKKRVTVSGNTVTAPIGVVGLGSSNTAINNNQMTSTLGVMMISESADGRESANRISGNTLDGHAGVMIVGSEGDQVEQNTIGGGSLGVFAVATRGAFITGNDISSDGVGVWTLNPISNTYGGTSISANEIQADIGIVAAERAAAIKRNDISGFADFGLFATPAMAATIDGNTVTGAGAAVGMLLFDTGGSDIARNTVSGSTVGILAAGDATPQGSGSDGASIPTATSMWNSLIGSGAEADEVSGWASMSQTAIGVEPSSLYQLSTNSTATDWTGNTVTGNGVGLILANDTDGHDLSDNQIRDNATIGLLLAGSPGPQDVTIRHNVITGNGTATTADIDAPAGLPDVVFVRDGETPSWTANDHGDGDTGPNGLQNFPVITGLSADGTTVTGHVSSTPSSNFLVDLYATASCHASGYGGAERHLGEVAVTTDENGYGAFQSTVALALGERLTSTATPTGSLADGGTSGFSRCVPPGFTGAVASAPTEAGDTKIEVLDGHGIEPGDEVIINLGAPNEEFADVIALGSLVFAAPLQFAHEAGEPIEVVPPAPDPAVSGMVAVTPARVFDSRPGEPTVDGRAQGVGRLAAGSVTTVPMAGRGGVDATAAAVSVNVTAVAPDAPGFVTLYPCDEDRPTTSNLNYRPGTPTGNAAVVALSADGSLCVYTKRSTDLVIDVGGWMRQSDSFGSMTPVRLFESRPGEPTADGLAQGGGQLEGGTVTKVRLGRRGGVPAGASAVALNVTAVGPIGRGFLTLYPCDADRPTASSLNYAAGEVVGNAATVAISAAGELCVYTKTTTHVVIDVNAWLTSDASFTPLQPARLFESRPGEVTVDGIAAGAGRLAAGSTTKIPVAGRGGVPTGATAVALNVSAVSPSDRGFVTLYPCDEDRPTASSLNYRPGAVVGNAAIVKLSPAGELCAFTRVATDLVVDVNAAWK